jgi:hypothetical protein
LVGVDKAQAALLTFNFDAGIQGDYFNGVNGGFTVNNSSLTGIGVEQVLVSGGYLNSSFVMPNGYFQGRDYSYLKSLAGARAVFYQGDFRGLEVSRSASDTYYRNGSIFNVSWSIALYPLDNPSMWTSRFSGSYEQINKFNAGPYSFPGGVTRWQIDSAEVSYTLVDTAPEPGGEPVPEPLTAGGTALALAGLSWLKHKKKMAA